MKRHVEITDGKVNFDFSDVPNGKYILILQEVYQVKNISYYQRLYGAMKSTLYNEGETGYKLSEIHSLAKDEIFPKLYQDIESNFISDRGEGWSTSELSMEGWINFIREFKIFSQEKFNCYL